MKRTSKSLYTRKYKKRRRNVQAIQRPVVSSAPLGRATKTVMRYASEVSIDPGAAGGTAVQVYSLNGLYDPDISGVGHQPMGFDQLNGLYNDYVVYGCLIDLEMIASDATLYSIVGATVYPGTTTSSDYQVYMENPHNTFALLNNTGAGDSTKFTYRKYIDIANVYGRTRDQLITEDYFKGNGAANPTDQICLHVWGAGYGASNPSPIVTVIKLTYYVQWFNPKLASKS